MLIRVQSSQELCVCSPELGAHFTANIRAVCLWLLGSEDTSQEADEAGHPTPVGTVGSLLGVERKWRELQESINPDNALGQGNELWTCPHCDTASLHVYFWAGALARYYAPITREHSASYSSGTWSGR